MYLKKGNAQMENSRMYFIETYGGELIPYNIEAHHMHKIRCRDGIESTGTAWWFFGLQLTIL